jgi:MATE family multidrug resistance protein
MASLMIGTLGVVPLAAHQVAITCVATAFMVPLGMAMATTVRVGEILGANERPRLHRVLIGSWLFAAGFMSISMLLFLLLGRPLAAWFVQDPEVVALAGGLLVVAALFQLFDGLQVVSVSALRGVNDVAVPAWMAALAYWGIALPLGWYWGLVLGWGANGVWAAMAVGLGAAAVLLGRRAWKLLDARAL